MAKSSDTPALPVLNPLLISKAIVDDYDNRRIASINDHEVRMSVMTAGFQWHRHPDSDESFLVLDGRLVIEFEGREVILGKGDFLTVPNDVLHRTRPFGKRSVNLTFEKRNSATIFA